ncbi:TetR family transcriptional regulator [Mycobacterium intermedium]|uniref:TetR family transcriptional regulator n=1 Tax=Mycobacterium intermedium TaxID=28445 RepID=A0A1E3SIU1_MYCIE|nr:TetR/AcrR family transcriptional regulator [Mycobacterium intermedium]MCV6967251.1 TetR/AcrR family transcriptional regulator [Mycobacterium intermedium]ODR02066.1 TetR family transcriptional regulator [Mycobacterium intermedium]OPE50236.1 TetR family transcriptional regulator [Mycobacterium intermedium]ORB08978.1 TetR family transcriptional regulator [Mycobacterium intermedium]
MARRVAPTRPAHGKQARAERTRARAIDVTAQIVLNEGLAAASGRHIADTAGVTWGVIQYHFGDRDGLLMAVVDRGFADLMDALKSLPPTTADMTTRDRVDTVVTAAWQAMSSPTARAATEILIGTRATRGAAETEHLMQLHKTFSALGTMIDQNLSPTQSAEIGTHLLIALRGMVANQLAMQHPVDTTKDRRVLVDIITSYIESRMDPIS